MTAVPATRPAPCAEYSAASIAVLPGLEAVRRRPSMYIGSTGPDGLHQLVFELVENALDEAGAGHGDHIVVTLHEDGAISVEDNGRGIPVDLHPTEHRPACEVVLTTLHSGGKFGSPAYAWAGGLHGVGLSCVCALSSELELDVWRGGSQFSQSFGRGRARGPLRKLAATSRTGTRIRFTPDPEIFPEPDGVSADCLRERLHAIAFLHPGLRTELDDRRRGRQDLFREESGLAGYVAHRCRSRTSIHPRPIELTGSGAAVEVTIALLWTRSYSENVAGFVNGVHTGGGGTHVAGLARGVCRALEEHARVHGMLRSGEELGREDALEGLGAVVSVRMATPEFDGQAKFQLISPAVGEQVGEVARAGLLEALAADPATAAAIVGRAVEAARARRAARRASENAHYHELDPDASREVYQRQFGIRSATWHDSCDWLTDAGLLEAHAELCTAPPGARLLDVCCGSGVVGAAFGARVAHKTGLDLTPEMRALASTRLDAVHAGTIYDLPFAAGSFDVVVTREVFHILQAPERPLAEILRVLRPGGQLIFGQTVPHGDADAAWMFRVFKKKQPLFFNNLSVDDYLALLARAGFERVATHDHFVWESIDRWIDSHETTALARHEIRDLYHDAPASVRAIHPFEILPSGAIRDRWRWTLFSAFKPQIPEDSAHVP